MKKIVYLFLLILTSYSVLGLFNISFANCSNINIFDTPTSIQTTNEIKKDIYSKYAIVYERNSGTILFEKNVHEKCPMASTTKIMTAIIVLENSNLSDVVTISRKSASTGGSRLGLKYKDKITVNNLLYGLLLCSGNDAAVALAEHVGGNYNNFMKMMNKKAFDLGFYSTHYESPHGLDSKKHYTTAYELALLTDYALKNSTFKKIVNTHKHSVQINNYSKTISNTNELLGKQNVYGVKTGFTGNAGRCLVTAAKNNKNLDIIVVVLGADTKKIRTKDSSKLISYAFDNFSLVNLDSYFKDEYNKIKKECFENVSIKKSYKTNIKTSLLLPKYKLYPINNNFSNKVSVSTLVLKEFHAPIKKGTIISKINLYIDAQYICSCNIINKEDISQKNYLEYLLYFFKNFKNISNNVSF
ncbi:MAG: D-alanyl-D-alanine carboxypeptidase [Clostridia bacterium]|nr:D-alanyl-D-alanine carboxypeptidase [Clostridia bacterium]